MRLTKKDKAYEILKDYSGTNTYILKLKKDVYTLKKYDSIGDFQTEYILLNHEFVPRQINKIIEVCDWYAEKKKDDWDIEFTPSKIKVISIIGETNEYYHVYIKFRQNMDPMPIFLQKKAVLDNFLCDDYSTLDIDFKRYDNLSAKRDPNRKIKEHQKEAVKFLLSRKKCILADDMGLGKSLELSVASVEGNFDSVLIICPASLKTNWKDELSWYVNDNLISIVESFNTKTKGELETFLGYKEGKSGLKREELIEEANSIGKWKENKFMIVNYDILDEFYSFPVSRSNSDVKKSFEESDLMKFVKDKKTLIIIDEAHKLSNRTSNRYKIIKNIIKYGKPHSIYLATGTPVTNNPQNLFCILQLLDDPIADDWDYYAKRYCDAMKIPAKGEKAKWTDIFLKKKNKQSWYALSSLEKDELKEFIKENAKKITITSGSSNLDELKRRISHIYLRRLKEDINQEVFTVTKNIHEAVYEMTPEQVSEYNRLWEVYVEEKKNANSDTTELNKELLEGAVYRKYISNIMIPYTKRIVDHWLRKGEKVIIFCCYDEELYALRDIYKDCCVIHNGKLTVKQKDSAVNSFKNDPDIKVFIGNVVSAGVGINLTVSNKVVFNNMSFVPGDNRQCEDRVYRMGQKRDCDIYYQYFKDTYYETMWNNVLKKETVINNIIKKEDEK